MLWSLRELEGQRILYERNLECNSCGNGAVRRAFGDLRGLEKMETGADW